VILVMTGTEKFPFGRLVEAVDELQRTNVLGEDFFLQLGSTPDEPRHVRFERFLSFGRVLEEIGRASVVVTHAGAGTALVCVQEGKHPILVPRLARHGEVIDDHQVLFADKMAEAGLATAVHDVKDLGAAVARVRGMAAASGGNARPGAELTAWLERFWSGAKAGHPRSR
jgi:UDP-N-acetylglucosamine transferase subunit ALG13